LGLEQWRIHLLASLLDDLNELLPRSSPAGTYEFLVRAPLGGIAGAERDLVAPGLIRQVGER